jgi:hypothetical protein
MSTPDASHHLQIPAFQPITNNVVGKDELILGASSRGSMESKVSGAEDVVKRRQDDTAEDGELCLHGISGSRNVASEPFHDNQHTMATQGLIIQVYFYHYDFPVTYMLKSSFVFVHSPKRAMQT